MKIPESWKINTILYTGKKMISIRFEKNQKWIELVKTIRGARWNNNFRCWLVVDSLENRRLLNLMPEDKIKATVLADKKLNDVNRGALHKLTDYMRTYRYSESTIRTYIQSMVVFLGFFSGKELQELTDDDVMKFNREYVLGGGLSASYQSQFVNALKLLCQIKMIVKINPATLIRPKKPFKLPNVLSMEEVSLILAACKNLKHASMMSLMYSAGLRRGELLNLRLQDIDSKRMVISIRGGKGNKDRIVPLSNKILEMLRVYYKQYLPKDFLFEGQFGGRYSERSLELIIKKAAEDAGIKKNINLHVLRHSYATHLMESGTNLRYIQELLGHKSPKTTQIYTHVSSAALSNVTSPFDRLNFNNEK